MCCCCQPAVCSVQLTIAGQRGEGNFGGLLRRKLCLMNGMPPLSAFFISSSVLSDGLRSLCQSYFTLQLCVLRCGNQIFFDCTVELGIPLVQQLLAEDDKQVKNICSNRNTIAVRKQGEKHSGH